MSERIEISGWINGRGISGLQILVLVLCASAAAIEGFDAQNIGYVAPAIIRDWHLHSHQFTGVFVSGVFGLLVGCLAIAPLADRFGRKPIMVGTLVVFGLFSLASASAHSLRTLSILRFLTDAALGGGMANAIAMTSEYFPARVRSWMTVVMFCGFPLGAALGGVLAAALIPTEGWPAVFVVGGILPLVLAAILLALLPKSIRHLAVRGSDAGSIMTILHGIDRSAQFAPGTEFYISEQRRSGLTVGQLMRDGRAVGTILIWIVFFMSLFDIFLLTSWLPVVLHDTGFSISASAVATAALQGSGVLGSLAVGPMLDRRGCLSIMLPIYILAAVGIASIGLVGPSFTLLIVASCAAGVGVVSGQNCANAFAAVFYPTYIRATGVGWALGIGRIGAILGPTLGGLMLTLHFSRAEVFGVGAGAATIAVLAILALLNLERAHEPALPAQQVQE